MEVPKLNLSGISLILPMYNERENIANTVSCINGILSQAGLDYEIIVCNDGSRDGSDWIASGLLKGNNRIRLISSNRNMGYGHALRSGFVAAQKDIVMYTDSDLPCDIAVLKDSLHLLNKVDAFIGFRNRRDNLLRQLYSIVYNTIVRAIFHIRVKDVNFSFKVFKRKVINSLDLKSRGPFIDAEMMAKAINSGYRIHEISMQYYPRRRGKSTLSSPRAIIFILYEMVKLYPEIMKKRRPGLVKQQ